MRVVLVTNIRTKKGLYRDAVLLSILLRRMGHEVKLADFRDHRIPSSDLVIQLEVVRRRFFSRGAEHWWIPNPEWVLERYLVGTSQFDRVLCKTQDAARVMTPYSEHVIHTGFMSEDRLRPEVDREPVFFHAFRGSQEKGTVAVQLAWNGLTQPIVMAHDLTDEEIVHQQNRCQFHLCPSTYEGWGHTTHEALSVGAIVATTDVPPMNEFAGIPYHIQPVKYGELHLARTGYVNASGVRRAVRWCLELSEAQVAEYSEAARMAYEQETLSFRQVFGDLVTDVEQRRQKR